VYDRNSKIIIGAHTKEKEERKRKKEKNIDFLYNEAV